MYYLRNLKHIPDALGSTVVTMGSYDGIHLGHQKIISTLCEVALQHHLSSMLISFNPYPKEFFKGERVPRLMSWREKFLALQKFNIDYFLTIPFNHNIAKMTAQEFVQRILVETVGVKYIVIGDDFRFGKDRVGDEQLLIEMGKKYGFSVLRVPTYDYLNERVSSSRIRHTLQAGNMQMARALLGHYYYVWGTVIHGNKLGRELGFPTANIDLHRRYVPLHGIYVVRVHGIDSKIYKGVAHIGSRMAVVGTRILLEVFIFDFSSSLYGLNIKVEFLHKLRDEAYYDSLELLKDQIGRDVVAAQSWHDQHASDLASSC